MEVLLRMLRRGIPGTTMPPFQARLSRQQMEDVITFLRTLVREAGAGH